MKPVVEVWMSTPDIPLMIEASLRTLLFYNPEIDFRIKVCCIRGIEQRIRPIVERAGGELFVLGFAHDCQPDIKIMHIHNTMPEHAAKVLVLDTDVTFHGYGVVGKLLEASKQPDVYCVGVEPKTMVGPTFGEIARPLHWSGGEPMIPSHVSLHCILLNYTPLMRRILQVFGGYLYMSNGAHGVTYWDGGIWAQVLETHDLRYYYVDPGASMHHWRSVGWWNGRYAGLTPMLRRMLADHPW